MHIITRGTLNTHWLVGQSALARLVGGHLEPTTRPADEPSFHCQAVSMQSKEALSNRRDAMDAEAGRSQPPQDMSLKGGWFGRPVPRSFLCVHRASAVPLPALRPNRHVQAARHGNESNCTSISQTNAVKAKPRLSGDTGGRLKLARVCKGPTSGIQAEYKRNTSGIRANITGPTP
jgi:hypothetical protein